MKVDEPVLPRFERRERQATRRPATVPMNPLHRINPIDRCKADPGMMSA